VSLSGQLLVAIESLEYFAYCADAIQDEISDFSDFDRL
jgi:hypothetical protein